MSKWTILAGTALALVAAEPAWAANCATVSFSPASVSFTDWDPINPAAKTTPVVVTIGAAIPSSTKTVKLIFLDNDANATTKIGSSGPQYQLTQGGVGYVFPSGTNIASVTGVTTSGQQVTPSFVVTVNANTSAQDYVGGTVFTEPLKYTVQCLNNGGAQVGIDSLQTAFGFSLTVPKLASFTTASPQTIDFGSFTTTTQTLSVGLKSTSSINVAVSTGGQMVLSGAVSPYPTNATIPYTMTLNGASVANGTNLTNQTRAGVPGTSWPLILTLSGGLPSGKIAGNYSDTITLTLTPGV